MVVFFLMPNSPSLCNLNLEVHRHNVELYKAETSYSVSFKKLKALTKTIRSHEFCVQTLCLWYQGCYLLQCRDYYHFFPIKQYHQIFLLYTAVLLQHFFQLLLFHTVHEVLIQYSISLNQTKPVSWWNAIL